MVVTARIPCIRPLVAAALARAGLSLGCAGSLGCGDASPPVVDAIRAERGPSSLELSGDPNGLFWDISTQRLYITDDDANRIRVWTDEGGLSTFEQLPTAPPEGAGLGQLVRAADGSIVVTRFGFGTSGGVAVVRAPGDVALVPGLDAARRRIGLTRAADGSLYDAWFVRLDSGESAGAVGQLSLDGSEPELLSGLKQPVGVLAVGEQLFVSDRALGQILIASRADPASYAVFASAPQPDLLGAGPDGSIFSGSSTGNVYRIDRAGSVSMFQTGLREVRGVAYDAGERRLFVAEHDPDEVRHALRIFPVD
jgi:hypothetical protein